MDSGSDEDLRCSFCRKSHLDVQKLIAGPDVFICDDCVEVCRDIIADDERKASAKESPPASASELSPLELARKERCALCVEADDPDRMLPVPGRGVLCSACVELIGRAVLGRTDAQ